ncbi:hypothetical protein ACFY84_25935 [Streptomyces sp. NPDC012438]|uniref:hypothetical protein n=1 Tax=Streptomyces sp. NPDC012438 TaxID=3364833 RepID=UPI0036E332F8
MKRHHVTLTAPLLAAGLTLTGCGESTDDAKKQDGPAGAVLAVAIEHQRAANALDWKRVCELRTVRMRRGTVEECAARNIGPAPTNTPSASASASPTETFDPPRYADGSTVPPLPKPTMTGPDRASLGPVTPEGPPIEISAYGDHPAGYGVLLTYTVTWPDETSTARKSVRVIQEEGEWRVDQREDVGDKAMAHGDPIRDTLNWG